MGFQPSTEGDMLVPMRENFLCMQLRLSIVRSSRSASIQAYQVSDSSDRSET